MIVAQDMLEGSRLSSRGMPNASCLSYVLGPFGTFYNSLQLRAINCSPQRRTDVIIITIDRDVQEGEILLRCVLSYLGVGSR